MMRRLPLCVVGGGSIGQRHINCAQASSTVDLTAVVDANSDRRAELAARGLKVVASLDDVPSSTRAAIVATPTQNHAATATACLDRGLATLVEKPVTETVQEAKALCRRADDLGVPLFTGYHRRCHPFVAEARARLIVLGELVAVQGIWCLRKHDSYFDEPWRKVTGAGPILTNLSHEIDLMQYFAGPITEVTAICSHAARGLAVEDTAALSFRFANGALGNFMLSDSGASPWAFEAATGENPAIAVRGGDPMRFVGTEGAMGFPSLTMWGGADETQTDWRFPLVQKAAPNLTRVDGIAAQLERFVAAAGGAADDVLATGQDGLETMKVLDAVQRAAMSGRTEQVTS